MQKDKYVSKDIHVIFTVLLKLKPAHSRSNRTISLSIALLVLVLAFIDEIIYEFFMKPDIHSV